VVCIIAVYIAFASTKAAVKTISALSYPIVDAVNTQQEDQSSDVPGDTVSAVKLSKPFFGIYLGETIATLKKRGPVESGTWSFTDPDHPGEIYDVLWPPEGVSALRVTAFRDRVYEIEVWFTDTTTTNLDAIKKRLELKYGKNTTGRFSGGLSGKATFAPTIDDVVVWITIDRKVGYGKPDTLTLTYRHSILAKIVQEVLENSKAKRVGDNL